MEMFAYLVGKMEPICEPGGGSLLDGKKRERFLCGIESSNE